MTGRKDFLHNLQPIYPYIIGLPNGAETVAVEKRIVNLGSNFKIHDVQFIPNLKCNLISLGRVIDYANCFGILSPDLRVT